MLVQRKRCVRHIFCADQPLDAAVVVDMRMTNNDSDNAVIAHLLTEELQCLGRSIAAAAAIHDDPAVFTADEGDVRNIIAAHLIDAVRDLKQAVTGVVLRVAPEAWVCRRGRIAAFPHEVIRVLRPDRHAVFGLDDERVRREDEAAACKFGLLLVVKIEQLIDLSVGLRCNFCCSFAFGIQRCGFFRWRFVASGDRKQK